MTDTPRTDANLCPACRKGEAACRCGNEDREIARLRNAISDTQRELKQACADYKAENATHTETIRELAESTAYAVSLQSALGSLKEMLAKQLVQTSDARGDFLVCHSCGGYGEAEQHQDSCIVNCGLAIIEAALAQSSHEIGQRKKFADLRAGMSPEAQERAAAQTQELCHAVGHPNFSAAVPTTTPCNEQCQPNGCTDCPLDTRVVPGYDAFQWTGDLDAFAKWFGERMPVDFGGQISVPVHKSNEGQWLGPWLRVWCGNWIIRHEGRCHTVTNAVYKLLTNPVLSQVPGNGVKP